MEEDKSKSEKKSGVEVTLEFIQRDIKEIKEKLEKHYVTADEFRPVRNIVYGLVAIILSTVLGWIVTK